MSYCASEIGSGPGGPVTASSSLSSPRPRQVNIPAMIYLKRPHAHRGRETERLLSLRNV